MSCRKAGHRSSHLYSYQPAAGWPAGRAGLFVMLVLSRRIDTRRMRLFIGDDVFFLFL